LIHQVRELKNQVGQEGKLKQYRKVGTVKNKRSYQITW